MLPVQIGQGQTRSAEFAESAPVAGLAVVLAVASSVAVASADNMDSAVRNTSADMLPGNNYCMP